MYDFLAEGTRQTNQYTTYDLIANVVHDSLRTGHDARGADARKGTYRVQLLHKVCVCVCVYVFMWTVV
jgi:hypothetical protein